MLAINPGSASTKVAVYDGDCALVVKNIKHSGAELEQFRNRPILKQQEFRGAQIETALCEAGIDLGTLSAVVGRGGLLPPLASGTYEVDERMLEELQQARRGEHASNLGAFLAKAIAAKAGAPAYVVDPVSVDEWNDVARLSGSAIVERQALSHALNSKAVAKRYAREQGKLYESLHLIVAHLGSGISVSAHEGGRMVDATNSREEGAFSTERAGGVPAMQLVELCFGGKYTQKQVERLLFCEGGLFSYLKTRDLADVERRILSGDNHARLIFGAMAYQVAKEIGAMATVLHGRADAQIFTGGMAHSDLFVAELSKYVNWIAPIVLYPGEDELQALVEGALRVLRKEESVREFLQTANAH